MAIVNKIFSEEAITLLPKNLEATLSVTKKLQTVIQTLSCIVPTSIKMSFLQQTRVSMSST